MHKNLFEIGSSLNHDKDWSFEKDDKKTKNKEIKARHEHSLVFKIEKRRGKSVSLVGEFFIDTNELKELCKNFKKILGTGGTSKDGWMEFQGDCQQKLKELVKKEGFRTKN
ncbi:MAG: translation initiation factor [Sulfurospirillaceae bacterium]|nr:translation initiation factor [Sulfurospirillaceae bacterium]